MPGKCSFQENWLGKEQNEVWLRLVLIDKYKALCKLCNSNFDVGNSGYGSVQKHAKGKKHQELLRSAVSHKQTILSFGNTIPTETSSVVTSTSAVSIQSGPSVATIKIKCSNRDRFPHQQSDGKVTAYLVQDEVTKAEILWALNKVMTHSSDRSSGSTSDLFPLMFPDSIIAQKLKMHKDKVGYKVTFGLGPHFQSNLVQEVNKCEFFCVSFDDSLNKIAQKGQMDIVVRYWDSSLSQVATRYLTSTFIGHATTINLLNAFTCSLSQLGVSVAKVSGIIQCDRPNVNLKFLKDFESFRKLEGSDFDNYHVIDVGTCSLHIVHGSYKAAHKACKWSLNDFLRALYLFKDFPSRRADYMHYTGSSVFPLKFCSIRWLENSKVIERALKMLPHLKTYVEAVKGKPPATKNYNIVAQFISDNSLHAKLLFLQSTALELEPFLTKFQSNDPLLPFLYSELYAMMRSITSRFVKKEVLNNVHNAVSLMALDVQKEENIKSVQTVDIGFGAVGSCKGLREIHALNFRKDCRDFLITLYIKLKLKSPLSKKIVKGASCLSPAVALSSLGEHHITAALEEFVSKERLPSFEADKVKKSYLQLKENPAVRKKLKTFITNKERLDTFWLAAVALDSDSHNEFLKFCHIILTLFQGNAAVERGFSVNKECVIENLHEQSLIAIRSVYGAVSAIGNIRNVPITKLMISDVRRVSSNRQNALKENKVRKDQEENARKRAAGDLKIHQEKKKKLMEQTEEELHSIDKDISKIQNLLRK